MKAFSLFVFLFTGALTFAQTTGTERVSISEAALSISFADPATDLKFLTEMINKKFKAEAGVWFSPLLFDRDEAKREILVTLTPCDANLGNFESLERVLHQLDLKAVVVRKSLMTNLSPTAQYCKENLPRARGL